MAMKTIGLSDLLFSSPLANNCGYRIPYFIDSAGSYFGGGNGTASLSIGVPTMPQRQLPSNCKNCGARLATATCDYCDTRY